MNLTKEDVLAAVKASPPQGQKLNELATAMALDARSRHRLRRLVDELRTEGAIERAPGARYRVPGAGETAATAPAAPPARRADGDDARPDRRRRGEATGRDGVVGLIRVHPAGYGFVEREDGQDDVFVPARFRGHALDGDKVRLSVWMGYKGLEGKVEEVVSRGRARLTGAVRVAGRHVYLEPDDPRIASTYGHVGLESGAEHARDGQVVVAEITRYPTQRADGVGELWARVVHVLGEADDPRTEVAKVIAVADIPDTFPEDALAAARRVPPELVSDDFADRIDLRDRPFLTIDPETARDFDDAVCLERTKGGWRLWVAVADVSHYVRPGTALDREARIRGCSVYLPDRAIPMLPHELSAEICSLKPEVDRCAMVVRLDLDDAGVIRDKAFCAAVIRSRARLDYPGVAAALAGDFRGARARYQQWAEELRALHALTRKMRARRLLRGSLDFDLPEPFVVIDEDDPRLVRDIRRSKSSPEVKEAYQLIEECMLAANEAVAAFFREREVDTLWRVHAPPSLERLEEFAELAASFGYEVDLARGQSPKGMQEVLKQVAGKPHERALSFLLLRSLKQATYDIVNVGHFGLASPEYLHFTSPIRRYPDLIVHRLLKYHLRHEGLASGGAAHPAPPPPDVLQAMAAESSSHERRAQLAEREVIDMYRAFLMRERVHEELDGILSGVTSFGLFVECLDPFVEGLIKLEALGDDSWMFEDRTMRIRGRRTGRAFALGDKVRVRVENVSVARRRIDLSLIEGGTIGELPDERPRTRRRGARAAERPGARSEGERGGTGRRRKKTAAAVSTPRGARDGARERERPRDEEPRGRRAGRTRRGGR